MCLSRASTIQLGKESLWYGIIDIRSIYDEIDGYGFENKQYESLNSANGTFCSTVTCSFNKNPKEEL